MTGSIIFDKGISNDTLKAKILSGDKNWFIREPGILNGWVTVVSYSNNQFTETEYVYVNNKGVLEWMTRENQKKLGLEADYVVTTEIDKHCYGLFLLINELGLSFENMLTPKQKEAANLLYKNYDESTARDVFIKPTEQISFAFHTPIPKKQNNPYKKEGKISVDDYDEKRPYHEHKYPVPVEYRETDEDDYGYEFSFDEKRKSPIKQDTKKRMLDDWELSAFAPPPITHSNPYDIEDFDGSYFTDYKTRPHSNGLDYKEHKYSKPRQTQGIFDHHPEKDAELSLKQENLKNIKIAVDEYIKWSKKNASGTRLFGRLSHWYHGASGRTRAQEIQDLFGTDENINYKQLAKSQQYNKIMNLALVRHYKASGVAKNSLSRYIFAALSRVGEQTFENRLQEVSIISNAEFTKIKKESYINLSPHTNWDDIIISDYSSDIEETDGLNLDDSIFRITS